MKDRKMQHDAKKEVLEALRKMAMDHMAGGLKEGLKKVSVMAPDKQGLEEGLDKAQEMLRSQPNKMAREEKDAESESPHPSEEEQMADQAQDDELSPDEIDAEIERLQKLKAEALSKDLKHS